MGFYSSGNDSDGGVLANLGGKGLQIFGVSGEAYGGRPWDMWCGYNTLGETDVVVFGIKDVGQIYDEDNFDDGDYAGWTVVPNANISWSVVDGKLRATVVGSGGYSYIERDGLDVSGKNITIECDLLYTNGAKWGGIRYRGVYLDVNPTRCGWRDDAANFYGGISSNEWHHVVVSIRSGDPYLMSDLYVDGEPVFLSEPIEKTNWNNSTVGFVSPYYGGYVEYDNWSISDEEYSFASEEICGERVPTNEEDVTFWPYVPDYDADWWEFNGTAHGGSYEWYAYLRGEGVHAYSNVAVYFAPRLKVEESGFPTNVAAGETVQVPVEWEHLGSNVPVYLRVALQDMGTGTKYGEVENLVTSENGSAWVTVEVPTNAPGGDQYAWVAYMFPTGAADPWVERLGFDDTYRSDRWGNPVEPEVRVVVSNSAGGEMVVYSDDGMPVGSEVYTWGWGNFDGEYTGENPPEGEKCFRTECTYSYAGWGVFKQSGSWDMSSYSNGYLRFWLKSWDTVKVEIEDASHTKGTKYVGSTAGAWQEISIPISDFSGVDLSQIYGLFEATIENTGTFYVDYVRWVR